MRARLIALLMLSTVRGIMSHRNAAARLIPRLDASARKGDAGRVLVVGGSAEYTGAPFYAGVAALKTGADLASIACSPPAAIPIKCYSPELMVQPMLPCTGSPDAAADADAWTALLSRMQVVVVGPGLGRDPVTLAHLPALVRGVAAAGLPLIIDGDGLYAVSRNPSLLAGVRDVVLTPNGGEFARLVEAFVPGMPADHGDAAAALSATLPGVVVVRKGARDEIWLTPRAATAAANATIAAASAPTPAGAGGGDLVMSSSPAEGGHVVIVEDAGCPRRCGGQGDILAGALATWVAWARRYARVHGEPLQPLLQEAAAAAASLTRAAGAAAFRKHGRATTAPDIIAQLGPAFAELFDASGGSDR